MVATFAHDAKSADLPISPPRHNKVLVAPAVKRHSDRSIREFGLPPALLPAPGFQQVIHTLISLGNTLTITRDVPKPLEMGARHPICRLIPAESKSMDNHQYVTCSHCSAVNRIPGSRLSDQPKCGQCKQPLFTGKPIVLSDANFAAHAQRGSLPIVVDFWAPWCGPCKMMAPHFERAAAGLEPEVRLAKLNTDDNPQVSGRFNIRSIPTMILFKNGQEVARQSGAMDANRLTSWIREHV